jgi:hypothetical protein
LCTTWLDSDDVDAAAADDGDDEPVLLLLPPPPLLVLPEAGAGLPSGPWTPTDTPMLAIATNDSDGGGVLLRASRWSCGGRCTVQAELLHVLLHALLRQVLLLLLLVELVKQLLPPLPPPPPPLPAPHPSPSPSPLSDMALTSTGEHDRDDAADDVRDKSDIDEQAGTDEPSSCDHLALASGDAEPAACFLSPLAGLLPPKVASPSPAPSTLSLFRNKSSAGSATATGFQQTFLCRGSPCENPPFDTWHCRQVHASTPTQ